MLLCFTLLMHISGMYCLDLFHNQDLEFIATTEVDLLWHNGGVGRYKRSGPELPGQLAFQFSVSGEKVVLNLQQNPDLSSHPQAFVMRGGRAVPDHSQDARDNMGFYQDVTKGAAIMVKKELTENSRYELMGTYIVAEEQYTIQPIRIDQGGGSSRTANHSIARMMTHISLRNDILDFVDGPEMDLEEKVQHKRKRRAIEVNTVELLIVTDFAIFNTWYQMAKGGSHVERRRKALENMKQYYAFVLNGIDLRYASIKEPDFLIDVTFAGIVMIDDPKESLWTAGVAGTTKGDNFVESSDALESFRSWVLMNDTSFPPHDHVMLFTGYNLTYGGSTANAGLAYIKSMCNPEFSISIVEEYFEFRIIAIAAHELGHSLGARHDMDGNKCFAFFLYIMTSRFRFPTRSKATNPWRFSKCSIDYFRKYIETLNSNGTNCMLTKDANTGANELAGFLGDQPGQVYTPDKQCQINFRSESSFVCRDEHAGKYSSVCSQGLLCRVPGGGGTCEKIVPADGTPCDVDKWCQGGRCVAAAEPLEWTGECPLGDSPGPVAGGQRCGDLVSSTPWVCYNTTVLLECCHTCAKVYIGVPECEYGDRQLDCQEELCPSYSFDVQNVTCCGTCHHFYNPTTTTTTPTTRTTMASAVSTPSTPSFTLLSDSSTRSEKLMKSELMPTSQTSVSQTTPNNVVATRPTTMDVTTSSQPTSTLTFGSPYYYTSQTPFLQRPNYGEVLPYFGTTLPTGTNLATSSPYMTTVSLLGHDLHGKGLSVRQRAPSARRVRLWNIARLRQMRQMRLRQRQDQARRWWVYFYRRLTGGPHNPPPRNTGTRGRNFGINSGTRRGNIGTNIGNFGARRGTRAGNVGANRGRRGENFSFEQSMEELEHEMDTELWGRGRRIGRDKRSTNNVENVAIDETEAKEDVLNKTEKDASQNPTHPEKRNGQGRNGTDVGVMQGGVLTPSSFQNSDDKIQNSINEDENLLRNKIYPLNTLSPFTSTFPYSSSPPQDSDDDSPTTAKPSLKTEVIVLNIVQGTELLPMTENSKHMDETILNTEKFIKHKMKENDLQSDVPQNGDVTVQQPDYLLHKSNRLANPGVKPEHTNSRFTYKVLNYKQGEPSDQSSWIFHAYIDPSMIPTQTKWITLRHNHRGRMMPFDGETYRGKSKGDRHETEDLPYRTESGKGNSDVITSTTKPKGENNKPKVYHISEQGETYSSVDNQITSPNSYDKVNHATPFPEKSSFRTIDPLPVESSNHQKETKYVHPFIKQLQSDEDESYEISDEENENIIDVLKEINTQGKDSVGFKSIPTVLYEQSKPTKGEQIYDNIKLNVDRKTLTANHGKHVTGGRGEVNLHDHNRITVRTTNHEKV